MAAAHVEHVVGHVGAGDVVGDHGHAVGAVGAGGLGDVFAADEGGGGDGVDVGGGGVGGDGGGLLDGAELQLDVQDGGGVGGEGEGLFCGGEAGLGDGEDVVAEGDGGDGEGAVLGGEGGLGEGGVGGVEFDAGAGDGAVLGVVDDSVNLAEDGGVGRCAAQKRDKRQSRASLRMGLPRQRLTMLELEWEGAARRVPVESKVKSGAGRVR